MTNGLARSPALAPSRRPYLLVAAVVVPVVVLFLFLALGQPVCAGDCSSYTVLMGSAPWKPHFWYVLGYAFRGWTLPVFFSLFGRFTAASTQAIVVVQALLLLSSTAVFAAAVASRFQTRQRPWVALAFGTMLLFQQGYLLFSIFLLSDAVAWALVLLLLSTLAASGWLLERFGFARFAVLYLGLGWMANGARDANQQLLILFSAYLLLLCRRKLTRRQMTVLAAGVVLLCAGQVHWARNRYRDNIENVLVARILPDPAARGFFLRHGMPPAYAEFGSSLPLESLSAVNVPRVVEERTTFDNLFGSRYLLAAPRTYALWLATHPLETTRILYRNREFILGSSFVWLEPSRLQLATVARRLATGSETDPRPETPGFRLRQRLLVLRPSLVERLPLWLRFALLAGLAAWGLAQNWRAFLSGVGGFSLLVSLAGLLNACSGFLADAWQLSEMERHAAIGSMLFNAGIALLVLWAVSQALERRRRRRSPGTH